MSVGANPDLGGNLTAFAPCVSCFAGLAAGAGRGGGDRTSPEGGGPNAGSPGSACCPSGECCSPPDGSGGPGGPGGGPIGPGGGPGGRGGGLTAGGWPFVTIK